MRKELYMLSMEEPIAVISAALAEKMTMEARLNAAKAQQFASIYAKFSYVPLLNDILRDIFNQQTITASMAPKMIEPERHLMAIGFDRYYAQLVVQRTMRMAIMIISQALPVHVMQRSDNTWSLIEPFDLWVYTNEPTDEDTTDS